MTNERARKGPKEKEGRQRTKTTKTVINFKVNRRWRARSVSVMKTEIPSSLAPPSSSCPPRLANGAVTAGVTTTAGESVDAAARWKAAAAGATGDEGRAAC